MDVRGSHCLSCKFVGGRSSRHSALNDLIWRALNKAGIPSVKEPSGLYRTDNKRPDGLTLIPWQAGKSMVWDTTVIDTLANSYIATSSATPGGAAEIAASRKEAKYVTLSLTHSFIPIALESLGPIYSKATDFLRELGRRLTVSTGDRRETSYLFQRLSVTLQRFNAVSFRQTFSQVIDDID